MTITGVIAEYDPFHRGHQWHLNEARRLTGCDYLVVVMDGGFTQRGEAALVDKRTRVRMALLGGADAVFELPALFAVRSADAFARGGVGVLHGLGADCLSFGAECADLSTLQRIAALREDEGFSIDLKKELASGKSYPRAWSEAASRALDIDPEALHSPNTLLAVEYLKAMARCGASMQVMPVTRRGSYHGQVGEEGYASASAIREALFTERRGEALSAVPDFAREALERARPLHAPDDLLLWTLRNMPEEDIASLADVPEGLEHRLKAMAMTAPTREALIDRVKSKRYTRARIARMTTHALLGLTREMAEKYPWPTYARLLGVRREALPLLKELKKRASLPIVSDPVKLKEDPVFQMECRATDLRALMCEGEEERRAGGELTGKFIVE